MAERPVTIGRYRIHDILARGGMGVVYRGTHLDSGEEAAIKTVALASEAMLASIRREIHALTQVSHPGIVRIRDQGLQDGLPWYSMELIRGRSLRTILDQNPERLPRRARLSLIRDLCAPLAFLHGAGIVHRDLKPGNIMIREDGSPALVDLGIAVGFTGAVGREPLVTDVQVAGSYHYMSPEQIRGGLVDARTDLYALGCILYECIAGIPPFHGECGESLLTCHLHARPLPLSHRESGLEPRIADTVQQLLAKKPGDRIGYAVDVARILGEVLVPEGAVSETPASAWQQPLPPARIYMYRPELAGRTSVMEELERTLEQRLEPQKSGGGSCIVLLGGESGVGKTRVAMELAHMARYRGMDVLSGQCRALTGDAPGADARLVQAGPLHPFRALLRVAADRSHDPDASASLVGAHNKILSPYEPALATVPGYGQLADLPRLASDAARVRVIDAVKRVLGILAGRPVLMILDDLQWADELSLAILQSMARDPIEAPVLIIGTYRSEERSPALDALRSLDGVQHLELDRLGDQGVRDMAAGMLGRHDLPSDVGDFLATVSSGNPFFASEYLRAAIDAGLLIRDDTGTWRFVASGSDLTTSLSLPAVLSELVEQRLHDLDPAAQALLFAAAVLGRTCVADLLIDTAAMEEAAALDAMGTLRRRQILEETGTGELRFVHDKLRETAYDTIPMVERRALHQRAGNAIESLRGASDDTLPELGLHWARSGFRDRAFDCFARAAERADAIYANRQAIELCRSALDQADAETDIDIDTDTDINIDIDIDIRRIHQVQELLADMWTRSGELEQARALYQRTLDGNTDSSIHGRTERARLYRKIADTWQTGQRKEEALNALKQGLAALSSRPGSQPESNDDPRESTRSDQSSSHVDAWWREWLHLHIWCAEVYYTSADVEEFARTVAELELVIEKRGTPEQRARFLILLMQRNLRDERFRLSAETVEYARRALVATEVTGNPIEIAEARFAYAVALLWHDALEPAEEQLLRNLDEAERLDYAPLRVQCLSYLTMLCRRLGDPEATRIFAHQCLHEATTTSQASYIAVAEANIGWIEWHHGNLERAVRQCRAALARWQSGPVAYPFYWMALWPLIAIARERGDLTEALTWVQPLVGAEQQRLPDSLTEAIEAALQGSPETDEHAADDDALARALELARDLGYL